MAATVPTSKNAPAAASPSASTDQKTTHEKKIVWEMVEILEDDIKETNDFFRPCRFRKQINFIPKNHPTIKGISIVRKAIDYDVFTSPKVVQELEIQFHTDAGFKAFQKWIETLYNSEMLVIYHAEKKTASLKLFIPSHYFIRLTDILVIFQRTMQFIESNGVISDENVRDEMLLWLCPLQSAKLISRDFDKVRRVVHQLCGPNGMTGFNSLYLLLVKQFSPNNYFKESSYLSLKKLFIDLHEARWIQYVVPFREQLLTDYLDHIQDFSENDITALITYVNNEIANTSKRIDEHLKGKADVCSQETSWKEYLSHCCSQSPMSEAAVQPSLDHATNFALHNLLAIIYEKRNDLGKALTQVTYLKDILSKDKGTINWGITRNINEKIALIQSALAKSLEPNPLLNCSTQIATVSNSTGAPITTAANAAAGVAAAAATLSPVAAQRPPGPGPAKPSTN